VKKHLATAVTAVIIVVYLLSGAFTASVADFGVSHDDGIYAVTAKSLAETGEYRIISLPGEPFQRKYPIMLPAILSLVWRLQPDFPGNVIWLKGVSLLAGAVFLAASYALLRRISGLGRWSAAVIVGITALAPATGEAAGSVMSCLVYGAFATAALWLMELPRDGRRAFATGAAIGLLAGCALLTRSIGLALLIAVALTLIWRRDWRALAVAAIAAGIVILPGKLLWTGRTPDIPRAYEYYISYGDWFRHSATDVGWGFLLRVPVVNLIVAAIAMGRTMVPSRLDLDAFAALKLGVGALALLGMIGMLLGLRGEARRRPPACWAIYLVLYFGLVLVWPFPPPPRFIVPVLPLVLLLCRQGLARLPIRANAWRVAGVLGAAALLASSGAGIIERYRVAREEPAIRKYEWIRANTAQDDVIACVLDPNCYLYTGRKGVSIAIAEVAPFYGEEGHMLIRPDSVLDILRASKASVLMIEPFPGAQPLEELYRDAVKELSEKHPGLLKEVWRDDAESSTIYRVKLEASDQSH